MSDVSIVCVSHSAMHWAQKLYTSPTPPDKRQRDESGESNPPAKRVKVLKTEGDDGLIETIAKCLTWSLSAKHPRACIEVITSYLAPKQMDAFFSHNEQVREIQGNAILHQVRAQDSLNTQQIYLYNKLIDNYGLEKQRSFRWIQPEIFPNLSRLDLLVREKHCGLLQTLSTCSSNLERLFLEWDGDSLEDKSWQRLADSFASHSSLKEVFLRNVASRLPLEISTSLTTLTLKDCTDIEEVSYIKIFKRFSQLTHLSLYNCDKITDDVLSAAPRTITYFRLSDERTDDAGFSPGFSLSGLRQCLSQLTNLQNLAMFSNQYLALDGVSNKLRVLGLELGDKDFGKDTVLTNAFAALNALEELYLIAWKYTTGEPLQQVSANLKHLKLKYCDEKPHGVPDLAIERALLQRFRHLISLEICSEWNFSGSALAGLSPTIQKLCLLFEEPEEYNHHPDTMGLQSDVFAKKLPQLKALNTLILRNMDNALRNMRKFPLEALANFPSTLTELDLRNSCQLTEEAIGAFQEPRRSIWERISKIANLKWGELGEDEDAFPNSLHMHIL